jgi:LmbE family N-acetylglucosaminyl deacetylase
MAELDGAAAYLFLSPHLDDAVLSCGALIGAVAGHAAVTVATIFTEAAAPPHTFAARSFLRGCGFPDASSLYAARQAEDRSVLDGMRVRHLHLGRPDALFRQRRHPAFGRFVPELAHRYPTYRYDIARGRVSRGDDALRRQLVTTVRDLVEQTGAELLFCPVGVGRHVDHLLTRSIGEHFGRQVVYYADFPYNVSARPDPAFVERHRLKAQEWDRDLAAKQAAIAAYRTQAPSLFPDGRIPQLPEVYFRPAG